MPRGVRIELPTQAITASPLMTIGGVRLVRQPDFTSLRCDLREQFP